MTAATGTQYTQANQQMQVYTPLGEDVLLLVGVEGHEAISELFCFELDLLAERQQQIEFEKLLGERISVRLQMPDNQYRYINGICSEFAQGETDEEFTSYRMVIVPEFWLLTRRKQSRIFQQKTVPDILREVLNGLDVCLEVTGTFHPRDYCVQYRESDFDFASRLMEEEGIFYFFRHDESGHKLVLGNAPTCHRETPGASSIRYHEVRGGIQEEEHIFSWTKKQSLRSSKYTLRDHCFELPGQSLEAIRQIQDNVQVGAVTHCLKSSQNGKLELYDWPGEYAQRFDGVDAGAGDRAADLPKIFEDNQRTARIRMEQEAATALRIEGTSNCRQLTAGHKFALLAHADANDDYVLTSVTHKVGDQSYRSGQGEGFCYENAFTCLPLELPFRPPRQTAKPVVAGTQTAVVVGVAGGEEIYTDKYGRVKVQFHWDRHGKNDLNSSCWIRVATTWAGKRWGVTHIPRKGQEVVVAFEEGDIDRPIIIGSVYNAEMMPPYLGEGPDPNHKHNPRISGIKSQSTPDGSGYNELRFDDTKDKEQIFFHAERNQDVRIKKDLYEWIGQDCHRIVTRDHLEQVDGDYHQSVKGDRNDKVDGTTSLTAGQDRQVKVGQNYAVESGTEIHLKAGMNLVLEAQQLTLKSGGNFITIDPSGVGIVGTMVRLNSGGAAGAGAGCSPDEPKPPQEADDAAGGEKTKAPTNGNAPANGAIGAGGTGAFGTGGGSAAANGLAAATGSNGPVSPKAQALKEAARDGQPHCEICEKMKQAQDMLGI